ncbi:MAG: Fibronectin type III domain protein [bacterium ADurb.Bin212]|nr:MAG: Fibronectin type III domain protein [bacterium ADurb.Bin212]
MKETYQEKFNKYLEDEIAKVQKSTKTLFRCFQPMHLKLRDRFTWYYKWHLKPYHRHVHYSTLTASILGVAVALSSFFYANPSQRSFANEPPSEQSEVPISVSGRATLVNSNGDFNFNSAPYHSNVAIDNISKNFTGYAWSEDLGWVAFGSQDNSDGPVAVDQVSGKVSGKAKVLSTGSLINFNSSPYNSSVTISINGDFSGYAWSEDLGWVNFSGVKVPGITFVSPKAPSNVRGYDVSDRNLSDYAVLVRWQAPLEFDEDNFKNYLVEKSTNGVDFTQVSATMSFAYYDTAVTVGQKYFYRIKTENTTGTTEVSQIVFVTPTGKYTTPPNLVSGPDVTINPTSIAVKWATDRPSSSFVQIKDGNTFVSEQGQTEQTTSHEVKVVGLRSQREYAYVIRSVDIDGNVFIGEEKKIQTANTPNVYDIQITNVTQTSAIINFKSTAIANFILRYGEDVNTETIISESSDSKTTSHSMALTNLKPGTFYFFRIVGEDSEGNELRSEDSFSTLPMPEISKFGIEPVKDAPSTTLKVTWRTNAPTTSAIKYSVDGTKFEEKAASDLVTDHEIVISDLADNSVYTVYAAGRDQFGNLVESEKTTYSTPDDTRPPRISNIVIESSNVGSQSDNKAQIAVSWKTDEPATSQIEYGEGIAGEEYTRKTSLDGSFKNHHLVIIADLDPGKPYHLRVVSADQAGNISMSGDNTVITGEVSKSALSIIVNALQNVFGWMGNLIK